MLGKKKPTGETAPPAEPPDPGRMALDALAANPRSMAEFALEQEGADVEPAGAAPAQGAG